VNKDKPFDQEIERKVEEKYSRIMLGYDQAMSDYFDSDRLEVDLKIREDIDKEDAD